jgi:phytoene desaturase
LSNKKRKVGIIGAGLSSLYAACYLAKNGYDVSVFEKNGMVGGRTQWFEADGFRFDMGPSWYWMPELIDSLFVDLKEKREDYFLLNRLETSYEVFWDDNSSSKIPSDLTKLYELFESFEEHGSQQLNEFLKAAEVKYTIATTLLENPGLSISELMKWDVIKNSLKLDVLKSVEKDVSKRFSSNKARSILNFPVLFLGSLPGNIPSLYTLMNHADLKLGTWYPKGGMHALAEALHQIALNNGVNFQMNTAVEEILVDSNQVAGLKVGGVDQKFDFILSGADYEFVEQNLLPEKFRKYSTTYWSKRKMAPSSLIYYVGVNRKIPALSHHNLFFDEDLFDHGKEIYETPKWPSKPLFYICSPSQTDASVAPAGCENLFFLMPIATDLEDPEPIREAYFDLMLDRLFKRTGVDIRPDITYKRSFCVSDFKTEYNAYKGNAYGLANTLRQTANLKPKMKSKLKNLFFCGQLTVPGPGIPPALISGKIAAKQIMKS